MTDVMQPLLFDNWTVVTPAYERQMTIAQRFEMFHAANPTVYARLREMALGLRRRGRERYSINGLFEALRWQHAMQTDDPTSEFKLNNDFRALYARRLMEREPDLADFFETRKLRIEQ